MAAANCACESAHEERGERAVPLACGYARAGHVRARGAGGDLESQSRPGCRPRVAVVKRDRDRLGSTEKAVITTASWLHHASATCAKLNRLTAAYVAMALAMTRRAMLCALQRRPKGAHARDGRAAMGVGGLRA